MISFPDEGHWVLKPKNSEFWNKEVFAWLAKYAPPGGEVARPGERRGSPPPCSTERVDPLLSPTSCI